MDNQETVLETNEKNHKICLNKSVQKWLMRSLNTLIIIIVFICIYKIRPRTKNGFFCQDPKLSFPYEGETITFFVLLIVDIGGVILILLSIELYREKHFNRNWCKYFSKWMSEYLLGFLIHVIILMVMKSIISEKRPHFFDTCQPDTGFNCREGEYINDYVCTNKNVTRLLLSDSQRSFPSGHTSVAVYTSLFGAFFVHYRLNSRQLDDIIKPLFITIIIAWSLICSLTRISDNRHHWWDVVCGALLGIISAAYQIFGRCNQFQSNINLQSQIANPKSYQIINQNTTNIIV